MRDILPRWMVVSLTTLILFSRCATAQENGFGRFGRDNDDGLLTLNVTPTGFSTVEKTPLQVEFGDGTASVSSVPSIDATQKTLLLKGGGPGAPDSIHYTLLYPGFSAHFGRTATLRLREGGQPGHVDLTADGLLTRETTGRLPLMILPAPGIGFRIEHKKVGGQTEILITASGTLPLGDIRFITPTGLDISHPSNVTTTALRSSARFWRDVPLPERESFSSHLSADSTHVTISETYRKHPGINIAPVPPVLAFALQHGYPAHVAEALHVTGCVTKYGPFAFVQGNTLTYTLPVPPTEERGYIRASGDAHAGGRIALLNSLVGHLGGDWASNAVDLGYAGMANATMAWAYLSPEKRTQVMEAWKTYLPRAFTLPPYPTSVTRPTWHRETEPLTEKSYLWTYFIDGPRGRRYDVDWGDTLPLYGLYKYAQYTGDWDFVQQVWPQAREIYRYIDLGDDWAWMTVVNADHGYSTGTGDPMAATFCGTLACLKMATALGDKAAQEHFAMKAARIAVPVVARFGLTSWARKNGLIEPGERIEGFWEKSTFTTTTPGTSNPWGVTSILSGDGILPEIFATWMAFDWRGLAEYEAEYERSYPHWFEPDYKYPFPTSYQGNSVYVTFPHIYARALLDGSGTPNQTEQLWKWLETAEKNRNNAWVGPNVVAELLSHAAPLTLTEWQPARYDDGSVSADGKHVTLTFTLPDHPNKSTITAEMRPGIRIMTVTSNGKPARYIQQRGRLQIELHSMGRVTIEIACN